MLLNPVFINTLMNTQGNTTNTQHIPHPTNFKLIKNTVARGLWVLVKYARSSYVYFTPKRVAKNAGIQYNTPMILHLIRYTLDELVKHDYIHYAEYNREKKKYVYYIDRDSPLWGLIKQGGGPEDVLNLLEKVVP